RARRSARRGLRPRPPRPRRVRSDLPYVPECLSRRVTLPRQGARELRAKLYGFEVEVGMLRSCQLLERRRSNDDGAVAVPAPPVQQCGGRLNQPLPDPRLVFLNNRTPDCFHRFVRQPELAAIKEILGMFEVALTLCSGHR